MRELFEGSGVSMLGLGIPLKGTTKYSLSYTTFGSQKLSVYSGQFSQDIDVNIDVKIILLTMQPFGKSGSAFGKT